MKNILFSFSCTLFYLSSFSQSGRPYAIWEDQIAGVYKYVQLDAATGTKTDIAAVPGLLGFVMGNISCFNTSDNYYHFAALSGSGLILLYTLDASSGAVISNPVMAENIIGIEYNCNDSKLYGLRENSNIYDLVSIDPVTATSTLVASVGFLNGHVGGSFSLNTQLGHYSFIALVGTGFVMKTYDITTGSAVASVTFPDNVSGHKYSCLDNGTYGLWENAGAYKLERIDPMTGLHTTAGTLTGVTPGFVLESQSVDENGNYTFRGFDVLNNFALFTVNLSSAAITASAATSDNAVGFEESACCNTPVTINAIDNKELFSLFPVPAGEELNLRSTEDLDWLEITTIDGKQKIFREPVSKNMKLTVSGWAPGLYLIRAGNKKNVAARKYIHQ